MKSYNSLILGIIGSLWALVIGIIITAKNFTSWSYVVAGIIILFLSLLGFIGAIKNHKKYLLISSIGLLIPLFNTMVESIRGGNFFGNFESNLMVLIPFIMLLIAGLLSKKD